MTVETLDPTPTGISPELQHPRPPRRFFGLGSGQVVAVEVAVVLLIASTAKLGPLSLIIAAPLAVAIVVLGWGRSRGRWLSEWLGVSMRFRGRDRLLVGGSDSLALLGLAHPGASIATFDVESQPTAMLVDGDGFTALIELGESAAVPSRPWHALPSPLALLPASGPDNPQIRLQLLLHASTGTTTTPAGSSYRQLTGGRLLAGERALLAIRVQRAEGWTEQDLERALSGAIRKIRAKLAGVPHRTLGEVAALRVLGELAGHDGIQPVQEGWSALHIGGMLQATFNVEKWPQPHPDPAHALLPRLLRLPATMTTVSLTVGPWSGTEGQVRAQLTVRLAAPDAGSLGSATAALKQALAGDQAQARRLDGEHMDGLLATLPLGGAIPAGQTPDAHLGAFRRSSSVLALATPYGGSGLMIGVNRNSDPVAVRLFRPEATRLVLIGGVAVAQVAAVRAMALGAYVLVQTTRPWAWEAFGRGLGAGAPLTVMPPGPVTVPPATPLRPLMSIIDAGPVAADRTPGTPWHSTLVVRDDLSPVDVDVLGRADVALLQPLQPAEAAVAVSVLGLSRDQESWLSRAQPGMVGVVHKRSVRWAAMSQTSYEQQLIGPLSRPAPTR
jgi:type VII secretion protein EccE